MSTNILDLIHDLDALGGNHWKALAGILTKSADKHSGLVVELDSLNVIKALLRGQASVVVRMNCLSEWVSFNLNLPKTPQPRSFFKQANWFRPDARFQEVILDTGTEGGVIAGTVPGAYADLVHPATHSRICEELPPGSVFDVDGLRRYLTPLLREQYTGKLGKMLTDGSNIFYCSFTEEDVISAIAIYWDDRRGWWLGDVISEDISHDDPPLNAGVRIFSPVAPSPEDRT